MVSRVAAPGGPIGGCALLALLVLSGCASNRAAAPAAPAAPSAGAAAGDIVNPQRSARGNPPFYEVFGQRYYVLPTSEGYQQRGLASWYGRDFHGKPTSGGEPYDMHAMTAAHKTLPIPTWVEVRNLANGKRVIVRVNDRGPFVDDRIIDMSYRAAQELEMVRDGTALVEVRALGAPTASLLAANGGRPGAAEASGASGELRPERATERSFSIISDAAADTPRANDLPLRQMFVQVGAFSEHGNAERLVERLRQNGFDDTFVHSAPGQGGLHRVRIGPLADADHYDRVSRGLRSIGVNDGRLVVDN